MGYHREWLHHGDRRTGSIVNTIVLHATAGRSIESDVRTLLQRKLSYHYLITKSGEIYKLAPASKEAYHAGESIGPRGPGVNDYSIGIGFVHLNDGTPYTEEQYKAAEWLIPKLRPNMDKYTFLTTHYAITVKEDGRARKTDPRGVDIERIAKATGLTVWKPRYADSAVYP